MKKLIAFAIIVGLAFGLVACGDSKETPQNEGLKEQSVDKATQEAAPSNANTKTEPLLKGDSVCAKVAVRDVYGDDIVNMVIAKFYYQESDAELNRRLGENTREDFNKLAEQTLNILGAKIHFTEIKRSEIESVCVYYLDFAYAQTQITSEELQNLEKFLAQQKLYDFYQ